MQEEAFCGSEGGEERSNIHRDGTGWDQTSEMCQCDPRYYLTWVMFSVL